MNSRVIPLLLILVLLQSALVVGLLVKSPSRQTAAAPATIQFKVMEGPMIELEREDKDQPVPTDIPDLKYSRPIG